MSAELSWKVYVHDQEVCKEKCSGISSNLKNEDDVRKLVNLVSTCNVCAGHPDDHLVEILKAKHGKVYSKNGDTLARLDSSSSVCLNGKTYMQTVRSSSCQVLSRGKKCPSCVSYRAQLRAMYHRWRKIKCLSPSKRASTSSRTPFTHLRTPESRKRYSLLRARTVSAETKLKRLRQRLDESINHSGVTIQSDLHSELVNTIQENNEEIQKEYICTRHIPMFILGSADASSNSENANSS